MQEISSNTFIPPNSLKTAVLFLVFNRPDTTKQVFEAIRKAKLPRFYGNGIIGLIQLFSCSLIENREIHWHGRLKVEAERWKVEGKDERPTSNIEHRMLNGKRWGDGNLLNIRNIRRLVLQITGKEGNLYAQGIS